MTSTTTTHPIRPAELDAIVAGLTAHGDTYTLPDGRELSLVVERDDCDPMWEVNQCEAWGRVAWVYPDRCTGEDKPRPDGFDGDAVKLFLNGDATQGKVWWQPLFGAWGLSRAEWHANAEMRTTEIANVKRLLEDGFMVVGVKLHETLTDSLGHAHVVLLDSSWLGGIDSLTDEYLAEVVRERVRELPLDFRD